MAAYKAFREPALISDLLAEPSDFNDFDYRRLRYAMMWSFYENSAYRDIHTWAQAFRAEYGLYKYTRNVYNPSYRLGEFWKSQLMGGLLRPRDGQRQALPVMSENEALLDAIHQLWENSNWQRKKSVYGLYGAVFGDVALRVVDDMVREKVYISVVHPGVIKDVELDAFGNVKGYEIEEARPDPEGGTQPVAYREVVTRDGEGIVFEIFRNNEPYSWGGQPSSWREEYGFTPLVLLKHIDVGLDWGWSELHAGLSKFREVDDLGSKLHDQIRKMVDSPWLFGGVENPKTRRGAHPTTTGNDATIDRPEPGRDEIPVLYGPVGATAVPLVSDLDLAGASEEIKRTLAEIERDYPELALDVMRVQGSLSGRALRLAQRPVENKVIERRSGYDRALVQAQQMAIAIGGYRGYKGFKGFGLDSYAAGALDHRIGDRPVFEPDALDTAEEERFFWQAAMFAVKAGAPLLAYLKSRGWSEAYLKELGLDQASASDSDAQGSADASDVVRSNTESL